MSVHIALTHVWGETVSRHINRRSRGDHAIVTVQRWVRGCRQLWALPLDFPPLPECPTIVCSGGEQWTRPGSPHCACEGGFSDSDAPQRPSGSVVIMSALAPPTGAAAGEGGLSRACALPLPCPRVFVGRAGVWPSPLPVPRTGPLAPFPLRARAGLTGVRPPPLPPNRVH